MEPAGGAELQAVAAQLREFARTFGTDSPGDLLDPQCIVELATKHVPHTLGVGLTLVRGDQPPRTIAASAALAVQVDAIEYETGEGPCLDAIENDDINASNNLAADERWPSFSARAVAETPIRSMFGVRTYLSRSDRGALNFYAAEVGAFTQLDLGIGAIFSTLTSLALRHEGERQQSANLEVALASSRSIGTAIGVLMARRLLTADQAFDELRNASQQLHRKLRDVAADVIETGEIPTKH